MAIRSSQPTEPLNGTLALVAGIASLALALPLAGGSITAYCIQAFKTALEDSTRRALGQMWFVLWYFGAVGLLAMVAGVFLILRKGWAQVTALIYWSGASTLTIVMMLAVILWRLPKWWPEWLALRWTLLGLLGFLLLVIAVVVLVMLTARSNTRQRYASMVIFSLAIALALVAAVNMISRRVHLHRSMETLGRYGLSAQTKSVLADIDETVHLTCVYTATDEEKLTEPRRERVLELLDDLKIYSPNVEVTDVRTDAQKAEVIKRLRGELGTQADEHVQFLQQFDKGAEKLRSDLQTEARKWRQQPRDSYLNLWSVPAAVAETLDGDARKLEQARQKVSKALAGPELPDYASLVRDVKDAVEPFKESLENVRSAVVQFDGIAQALGDETKREIAVLAAKRCAEAAQQMAAALGAAKDPAPKDPTDALKKYVEALRRTGQLALAASRQIDNIAGKDSAELVRAIPHFRFPFAYRGLTVEASVPEYYAFQASGLTRLAGDVQGILNATTPAYQAKYIQQMRPSAALAAKELERARQVATTALTRLAKVDDASAAILKQARDGKLFETTIATLQNTLDTAGKLPELKDSSLSTDITEENIVIVEAGGKAEVIGFDEVWPMKLRQFGMAEAGGPEKRIFRGDAVIRAKIRAMTNKPFATVLLTYWGPGPNTPPQFARMIPQSDIPPRSLSALRKRLEEANFEVKDWNLTEEMPQPDKDDEDAKKRPKVLMVLPPPPRAPAPPFGRQQPMPGFGDEDAKKVTDAIDSGTPAIFLATFLQPRRMSMFTQPMQPPYPYARYLREKWSIDPKTRYLIIPAVVDATMPGRYKVDGQRFGYLPLSTFSDHPIGEPLQAQRVFWVNLCPIQRVQYTGETKPPYDTKIEPLLTVPANMKATWATSRIMELLEQFQSVEGSYIWPDYKAGDLPVPLDLAVAATRAADEKKKVNASRIVVLGVSSSFTDGYLDREVAVRDAKGTITLTDPPRANADLVINSVYWLIGRKNLIAPGPVQATMKEIPVGSNMLLTVLYCAIPSIVVLLVGGAIMIVRKL